MAADPHSPPPGNGSGQATLRRLVPSDARRPPAGPAGRPRSRMRGGRPRLRLPARMGSVRVRTTVAAAVVVGVAMAVGAVVLVVLLRQTLTREVRNAAELRAADVVSVLESGASLAGAPGRSGGDGQRNLALAVGNNEELLIQVVDAAGEVVASSPNVAGQPPVARLRPGESVMVTVPVDDDGFIAVAAAADAPSGQLTVIVARTLDAVAESTRTVTGLLAIGLPVLLLVITGTTWRVVGRALAPVDAIRREVDEVSAAELHRRVPDPPGHDEIARLATTMNRMLARLEEAQARQHRFVSDASHELRSPVAAIRQYAEVTAAYPGRISAAELAGTVLAESLRIQRLVEDLLLLARADEHTLRLRRRAVDLDDLVFDEAHRLRGTTELRVDTTAVGAGRVDGDASGLHRVLRNITENAARHARGRISFALAEGGGEVVLAVDDDGPGIPGPDRGRVLERFVRLDDARARDSGGSGLGLAIVSELVAAHGGTLRITDSPLGGARVEVSLAGSDEPDS